MARTDPPQPVAFEGEIDRRRVRVPLDVAIPGTEREPAEVVAPDELGFGARGVVDDDRRDRSVAERMPFGEMGEVRITHRGDGGGVQVARTGGGRQRP